MAETREEALAKYHKQRLEALRTDRSNFDNQWEDAAQILMPSDRSLFFGRGMDQKSGTQGQKKTELQFDATAALAVQRFAAVLESLVMPKASRWHFLKPMDKALLRHRRAREYFEDLTDTLFRYRYSPGSGFVTNTQALFQSIGVYGNGTVYTDSPDNARGLRYRAIHLSESYYVQNHARLIDTHYRPFLLEARQAVQQFGGAVPKEIQEKAGDPQRAGEKAQYLHVVTPRSDFVPGMLTMQGRPFQSVYLSIEPQGMVVEGGYSTFPYNVSRYTQSANETYGRGPAQWVLPSIKTLNEQKKTVLKQGHRVVDPVLLMHDDGVLDGFSMRAGAMNKGGVNEDGKLLVQPLPVGNIAVGDKMMDMERQIINDAFLISLFQILVENPRMTATEVLERMREKGMLLAPTAGRIEEELLGPMIERELDVLLSQGLLPRPPSIVEDAMREVGYTVEYDSPMSRMRRAEGAAGFTRVLTVAGEYANLTQDPSPLDWFNFDRAMPAIQDINGVPVDWTATPEEVAAKRDAREQAAQAKQMSDAAPGMAAMMKAMPKGAVPA